MTDRLSESARRIEAGEYDTAQRLLTVGYDRQLALYMEVYRTAVTTDLERVEQRETLFAETAALQRRYAERLSTYQRIAAAYERARQSDDHGRAQRRARELRNITSDLRDIEQSLTLRYQAMGETTDGATVSASSIVTETTTDRERRTAVRVREVYTVTAVTAEASPNGSFTEPIRLTGRLTAEGTDPPSGNVSFRVNGQTLTTTVDPDGTFALPYRPVTATRGPARIPLTYTPDDAALYLPSQTDVSTVITQSTPSLSIDTSSAQASAGSSVTTAGVVTADGTPVPNASVTLRIGEKVLDETRTNGTGAYQFDTRFPANISAGRQTMSVSTGRTGTALAPVSEDANLTVEETPTRLTLSAVRSEGAVNVAGRLVTESESGIGGEAVVVSIDGEQRATVQTTADGSYQTSVELSNASNASNAVSVRAAFDGGGGSLESASVSAALAPLGEGPLPVDMRTLTIALVTGVIALGTGGFGIYRYRRDDKPSAGLPSDAIQPDSVDPAVAGVPSVGDGDGGGTDADPSSGPVRQEDTHD
ncbi:hypothetical protein PM030_12430 [Halorubrum ezzemoulense]|uniref:hypothetical protein n=1 Tax=Halorubrum ezzemoulense TaxID=337243 RepID=UPI00232CAB95|nr:hypothetical protein [Halorubrum ezzemoulense]MDB2282679.1 hypothetical protein [Halorubrum ezzemoulense]